MTDKIKIDDVEFDVEQIKALAEKGALNFGQKNDPASLTLSGGFLHGPNPSGTGYGPLTAPGVRPQMISAMVRARSLASALPMMASDVDTEKIEIHTGVTAQVGTNATGFCGNPPGPGALKKCGQNYTFGDYFVKTDLLPLAKIGMRKDRADIPRNILNAGPGFNPLIPEQVFSLPDTQSVFRYQLWLIGVAAERSLTPVVAQGDNTLASTATHEGWIQEFTGYQSQVKTGYTDISTGLTCPAADSIVDTWNADVSTAVGGRTLTEALQDHAWALMQRAEDAGMMGVRWVISMRREAFYRIAQEVAVNVGTARGGVLDNGTLFVQPVQTRYEELLTNQYLPLFGQNWPVQIDDGIPQETTANQTYKSDIFFIPIDWQGFPLTYMEYFNMANQYNVEYGNAFGIGEVTRLNNGLWLVGKRDTGLCIEYHFQARMRLLLTAPFLASRIDDVWYTYKPGTHDPLPGMSNYADGGASYLVS